MEVNFAKNEKEKQHDTIVMRHGKTRIHFNEFTYIWTLENYSKFRLEVENVDIASPTIVIYNNNDKYEFQLKISTRKYASNNYYFYMNLQVLSCPTTDTKVHIRRSIVASNGVDYNPVDTIAVVKKHTIINSFRIEQNSLFANYLSDSNLVVKCKFTFRNGFSQMEHESPDLEAVRAKSNVCILDEYEKLLNSAKFTDVTIIVGDKKIPAHKAILASRSPVFSAMFEHKMIENKENTVEITDVDPQIMDEVLRFIYASRVKSIKESTADLLAAADKYQLESLRLMCEEVFIEKLSLDNLEEILKIVDRYETYKRLRNVVLKFLSFNGKEVANWKNFDKVMKTLSPSLLFEATKATMLKS